MTGVRIVIDDAEIVAALDQLERNADNPAPAMEAIGAAMVAKTQTRFQRETGPDGRKWQRLSPRTANARIGRGRRGTENILRVSNRLYSSIVYAAGDSSVEIGSNVVYAGVHQLGGAIDMPARAQTVHLVKRGRKTRFARAGTKRAEARDVQVAAHTVTIPARPYLGIDTEDRAEILAIVADHFRSEAK